jgi:hypothetical protein
MARDLEPGPVGEYQPPHLSSCQFFEGKVTGRVGSFLLNSVCGSYGLSSFLVFCSSRARRLAMERWSSGASRVSQIPPFEQRKREGVGGETLTRVVGPVASWLPLLEALAVIDLIPRGSSLVVGFVELARANIRTCGAAHVCCRFSRRERGIEIWTKTMFYDCSVLLKGFRSCPKKK